MHVTQKGECVRKQMMVREEGRYDKAGVPEGPGEQSVFTVKTIFINLADALPPPSCPLLLFMISDPAEICTFSAAATNEKCL